MYILRALAFLFLIQAVLAEQPRPILPDLKLTPGNTFDVTAEDVCVPGYAKKVIQCQHGLRDRRTLNMELRSTSPATMKLIT
jgi:hypothetical protein